MLSKRTKNKCQEIYYSNDVCMMQSSLGVLVVIVGVREGFNFVGSVHWADEEISEGWEPERNVPPLLRDRFVKGEREKMVT